MKVRTIRLLLVEDNPVDVRILRADFAKSGTNFKFTATAELREAFQILQQEPIDVILLDLFLGGTSGLDTLFRVREAAPDIPVVVLTSMNDEGMALQALKSGAQDYLIKGKVNRDVLVRAIRYAIERKQAEGERRLLEQRLLHGQKLEAVGTLAGGVAHNFNNMLMVILGHSDLLLETISGNDRRQVESIKHAAARAVLLTRQLLSFSRKQPAETTSIDLNKLIFDMQELLESTVDDMVHAEVNLTNESTVIRANPGKIREILLNLAMNARSAMTNGGKLTIATENRAGQVLLKITDTGCGMSSETMAHIFEPFFTTKGLPMASGLGLSTVYGIVKQHGGSIEVLSKPGEGSTFSISFPAIGGCAADDHRPQAILVVADEDNTLEFQLKELSQTGRYNILIAGSWKDALELADDYAGSIELLITDAVTPGLTRSGLLRHLASEHPEMQIIYVSGSLAASPAGREALPPGTYLDNSITPQDLLQRVEATMMKAGETLCQVEAGRE